MMSVQAATKIGKYRTSGFFSASDLRTGLKSVSSELTCSDPVMVPPPASKFASNAPTSPWV